MNIRINSKLAILLFFLISLIVNSYQYVKAQTPPPPYYVKVIVDIAKLRTGPDFSYPSNGYVQKGDVIPVYNDVPSGGWLLVKQNPDLWISQSQVEKIGEIYSNNETFELNSDKEVFTKQETTKTSFTNRNIESDNFNQVTGLPTTFVIIIVTIILLIPLFFGFHWRWFIGSFFACLFWGPIGLIFALYVAGLVLVKSEKITTYSPRDWKFR